MAEIKAKISLDNKEFISSILKVQGLVEQTANSLKSGLKIAPTINTSSVLKGIDDVKTAIQSGDYLIDVETAIDTTEVEKLIDEVGDLGGDAGKQFGTEFESDSLSKIKGANTKLVSESGKSIPAFGVSGEKAGKSFSDRFSSIINIGIGAGLASLATSAVQGIVNSGKQAVGAFIDLDKQVKNIGTLGVENFEEFATLATELSKTVPDSAGNIAKGVYQAISAGIQGTNQEIIAFTESAAKVGVAGLATTEEAVNGLTSVLNAYGLKASDVSEVSDGFFATIKLGKTDFNQLNASLSNVIPAASAAGVNFDEVAASISQMTALGVPTAQATTQIRSAIVELQKPTGELKTFMDSLGLSAQDVQDKLANQGLIATLQELEGEATAQGKSFNLLFGSMEAGSAATLLTGKNAERATQTLVQVREEIEKGVSTTAYETAAQSLEVQLSIIKNNIQALFNDLFTAIQPAIQALLPVVQNLVASLKPAIEALAQALIPIINVIGTLIPTIANLLTSVIVPLGQGIATLITAIQPVIDVIIGLVNSLVGSLAPVLEKIINMLVSALVPIFGALAKIITPIIQIIDALASVVIELINAALDPISAVMQVVVVIIDELAETFVLLVEPLVEMVQMFAKLIKPLLVPFSQLLVKIIGVLPVMIRAFASLVQMVIKLYLSLREGILDAFMRLIGVFFGTKDASETLEKVLSVLTTAIEFTTKIVEFAVGAYTAYAETIIGITDAILEFFGLVEKQEKKAPFAKTSGEVKELNKELSSEAPKEFAENIELTTEKTKGLGTAAVSAEGKLINLSNVINEIASRRINLIFDVREQAVDSITEKLNAIKITDIDISVNNIEGLESIEQILKAGENVKQFFGTDVGGVWLDKPSLKLKETINEIGILKKELTSLSDQDIIQFNIRDILAVQNEFIGSISELRESTSSAVLKQLEREKQDIFDFLATAQDLDASEVERNLLIVKDLNDKIVQETIRSGKVNNKEKTKLDNAYLNSLDIVTQEIIAKDKEKNKEILKNLDENDALAKAKLLERETALQNLSIEQAKKLSELKLSESERANQKELEAAKKAITDRYAEELRAAIGNQQLFLELKARMNKELADVDLTFEPETNFDKLIKSFSDVSKELSKPFTFDKKQFENQRNEILNNQKTLQQSLQSGEISYEQFVEKQIELDKQLTEVSKQESEARFGFLKAFTDKTSEIFKSVAADSAKQLQDTFQSTVDSYLLDLERVKEGVDGVEAKSLTLFETMELGMAAAGSFFLGTFGEMLANGENTFKALGLSAIDTATVLLNAWAAPFLLKANVEQPFGLGTITFAAVMAAANVLLGLARSAVSGAESGVVGIDKKYNKKAGRTDSIPLMVAPGESIINKDATALNFEALKFMNSGGDLKDYFKNHNVMDTKQIAKNFIFVNEGVPELKQMKNIELKLADRFDNRFNRIENELQKMNNPRVEFNQKLAIESQISGTKISGNNLEFLVSNAKRTKLRGF